MHNIGRQHCCEQEIDKVTIWQSAFLKGGPDGQSNS